MRFRRMLESTAIRSTEGDHVRWLFVVTFKNISETRRLGLQRLPTQTLLCQVWEKRGISCLADTTRTFLSQFATLFSKNFLQKLLNRVVKCVTWNAVVCEQLRCTRVPHRFRRSSIRLFSLHSCVAFDVFISCAVSNTSLTISLQVSKSYRHLLISDTLFLLQFPQLHKLSNVSVSFSLSFFFGSMLSTLSSTTSSSTSSSPYNKRERSFFKTRFASCAFIGEGPSDRYTLLVNQNLFWTHPTLVFCWTLLRYASVSMTFGGILTSNTIARTTRKRLENCFCEIRSRW